MGSPVVIWKVNNQGRERVGTWADAENKTNT